MVLCALVGAGWMVYRQLPNRPPIVSDGASSSEVIENGDGETVLRIVLNVERGANAQNNYVELYSVDVAGVESEFRSERRVGARFEDFIRQRMRDRAPLSTRFDARGQAVINVHSGRWWIHATHENETQELTWRLPVRVVGREQTIVLTPENAYMRTQSF